jgi:hypothetical protein
MATKTEPKTVKRVRRVAVAPDHVEFTLPSGAKERLERDAFHTASNERAWAYGVTQLFQDGLARGKADAPATDEDALAIVEQFRSGDWATSRSAGGRPTMDSTAAAIVAAKYPKLKRSDDEFKSKVVALLDKEADATRYAKLEAEFNRRLAAWEDAQAAKGEFDI